MKSYLRSALARADAHLDQRRAQQVFMERQAAAQRSAAVAKPKLNRAQRRKNELFNRKLQDRLAKDGTPAEVKLLDDGGIHVSLSKEELEMRHAEEGDVPQGSQEEDRSE